MRKIDYFISVLLFYLLFSNFIQAQLKLRDDFKSKSDYWYWRADGNQSIPMVENGLLHLHLNDATSSEYCNTEIYDPQDGTYSPGTQLKIRLKCSPQQIGSRGWGFWDGKADTLSLIFDFDVAWFMQQGSDVSGNSYNWSLFGVNNSYLSNNQVFNLQNILDETNWHTYKILWEPDSIYVIIDNITYYVTYNNIPDQNMRFDTWIDNRVINIENPLEHWNNDSQESEIFVDYVEISGKNGTEIKHPLPQNILLWESPNSFPNGENNALWKTYNFNISASGEILIYITGNAESYPIFNNSDKLKIIFDGNDYGWNSDNSLNGDILGGKGHSISLPVKVNAGNHTLEIRTEQTPFISDIIVVNSKNKKTIFNKNYDQVASGSNSLWKTIEFNSNDLSILTFLISSSGSYDNNLRFEIDDKDLGWNYTNGSNGNNLQNFPNTTIITDTIGPGTHYLNIYKTGNPVLHNITIYGSETLTDISQNPAETFLPNSFDVYPNPFNITTNFQYKLSTPSKVKISVYNILGELILSLFNEYQNVGVHNFIWNADKLNSGIYFCTISTKDFIKTRKVILLK